MFGLDAFVLFLVLPQHTVAAASPLLLLTVTQAWLLI